MGQTLALLDWHSEFGGNLPGTLANLPAAIMCWGYAPGLLTAVLVGLPVMTLLTRRAIKEGYVSGRKAVAFGVGAPVGIVALAPALFALGRWL